MKIRVNDRSYDINIEYDENDDYFILKALDNGEQMGYISFKPQKDRSVWLYKIETDEKYAHQGVGTALLFSMEYISSSIYKNRIEAKFYPLNEFAKPFYEKYGYEIYKDGYETYLEKSLDYDFIESRIKPNIKVEKKDEYLRSEAGLNLE